MLAIWNLLKPALLGFLLSKKVITAVVGFLLSRLLPGLSEDVRLQIVGLAGLIIAGFAASDAGKEKAKISPSLAPTVFAPSVSGGVPQARDNENPINDRR